jgi:hypothetical protein
VFFFFCLLWTALVVLVYLGASYTYFLFFIKSLLIPRAFYQVHFSNLNHCF